MFSNFYQIDLHNETCDASTNLWFSIKKKWIDNQTQKKIKSTSFLNT